MISLDLNDIRKPDGQEETVTTIGNVMGKRTQQKDIGLKIFYTILAVYGFLTFLNPKEFPITRGFLENTPYFY